MNKKSKFNKIARDIKSIKIQGAKNIALAGFKAYKFFPNPQSKKKIISLRPTEPFLINVLNQADKISYNELKEKLKQNQDVINKLAYKIIKNNSVIFTHCHSSTVVNSLIYCHKKAKKFEVYNTEARPLYQGRITASELRKAGIKVTMFVDSAAATAIKKQDRKDKIHADLVLFGTDAILENGVVNKIGSGMFAEIAYNNKVPVYILTDSLKYIPKIKLEQRSFKEVWKTSKKIKIKNPAFELVNSKYITSIISELGNLSYNQFLKKVKKTNKDF
jgi:translation initiation factor 2B subunit (eIF-2B alpha/beta/delta family)